LQVRILPPAITMKHLIALSAASLTVAYMLYTIYEVIDADGTWYNQLYMDKGRDNVTFVDKLKLTLTDDGRSINKLRLVTGFVSIPVAMYLLVRIVVAGVINF